MTLETVVMIKIAMYKICIKTINRLITILKAGFHMIATIAGRNVQQLLRSCENHFLAIVATTAIMWKPAYTETA